MNCLSYFSHPNLQLLHSGKVRDSFRIDDQRRLIVVTDRISAFNKKIKTPIPYKGAVLNSIAAFWFDKTRSIIENHIIEQIDPQATIVKEAEPIRVEMVVRGYLTGSMGRDYAKGKRTFSGITVPDGLKANQKFPTPIITPTTKDDDDTEVTEAQIVEMGLATADIYNQMKTKALELFALGSEYLEECGIILVDTKYEFGLLDGKLILIDEIHTPDSSRFWRSNDYLQNPEKVEQMDKEFVRQWLLANQVDGDIVDVLPDDVVEETSRRYREIYRLITTKDLAVEEGDVAKRLEMNLKAKGVI